MSTPPTPPKKKKKKIQIQTRTKLPLNWLMLKDFSEQFVNHESKCTAQLPPVR